MAPRGKYAGHMKFTGPYLTTLNQTLQVRLDAYNSICRTHNNFNHLPVEQTINADAGSRMTT